MSDQLRGPRTLEYCILRVCERMGVAEERFLGLPHAEQLRLLAYEQLRQAEERSSQPTTAVW